MKSIYQSLGVKCVQLLKLHIFITANPGQDFMQFVKANVFFSPLPSLKTLHVWMKMAAQMEFHPGLDEVREHLHCLSSLFFLSL